MKLKELYISYSVFLNNLQFGQKKYYQIAKDNGLEFKTLLFETTGRMYHKSIDFTSSILNRFNSGYKNGFFLKKYWLDRISCTFQRHVANGIIDKLKYLNGIQYTEVHYENQFFLTKFGDYLRIQNKKINILKSTMKFVMIS